MSIDDSRPLRSTLDRAQKTLKTALDSACDTDLKSADTGELIRIEEVLAIANEAAKQAISVRRRLGRQSESTDEATPESPSRRDPGSREIEDAQGARWVVFAVRPSSPAGRASFRERYRNGWLTFDSGVETRRVAPIPDGWENLPDHELLAL